MAPVADPAPAAVPGVPPFRIGIDPPPDFIFRNRADRVSPASGVWGGGSVSYVPQRAEYLEGKGNFVHYLDVPFPSRCVAPVEAIYATDHVKKMVVEALRFLSSRDTLPMVAMLAVMGGKRRARVIADALGKFVSVADKSMGPYYLNDGYYCGPAKSVRAFCRSLFVSLGVGDAVADRAGELFGACFEYDNAYRFRLQDMVTEADEGALSEDFPKEARRLLDLEASRERIGVNDVTDKFRAAARLLRYAWAIPSMRRAIRKAIADADLGMCRLDEADIYHTYLYGDYDIGGKGLDERLAELGRIHGKDQANWPPRVMIRNK